jgi:hypothetical protein
MSGPSLSKIAEELKKQNINSYDINWGTLLTFLGIFSQLFI